ncbi:12676_t:CDS:2, partial [Racocetra fulgida]
NFDELGFPANHPGRSTSDSYYINTSIMLRTHTSAHQRQAFQTGAEKFLISADVYRRDEIDTCHYPVFHQMEGAQIFSINKAVEEIVYDMQNTTSQQNHYINTDDKTAVSSTNPIQPCHPVEAANATISHLKYSLNELVRKLFIDEKNLQVRWVDAYFPFTSPSWEMEIFYQGKWLEDPRFLNQFTSNEIIKFKPFSKYPSCIKDLSFWMNNDKEYEFHITNFCEIVRDIAEDLVEDDKIRKSVVEKLDVTLR